MKIEEYLSESALAALKSGEYKHVSPFPYIVIDNFLQKPILKQIVKEFPGEESDIWWEYNNPLETKFGSDDIRKFPSTIASTIHALNHQDFISKLGKLTGIKGLMSDPYLHGGGLHCTRPGGKLDIHVDYGIHPKLHMERRINLILYLVPPTWKKKWGGAMEFWTGHWDEDGKKPFLSERKVVIPPKYNRAIIFNTGDLSFHGHPEPLTCPSGVNRKSIALYYLSDVRKGVMERYRARYVARPGGIDPVDEETEKFREERSRILGKYKTNKKRK